MSLVNRVGCEVITWTKVNYPKHGEYPLQLVKPLFSSRMQRWIWSCSTAEIYLPESRELSKVFELQAEGRIFWENVLDGLLSGPEWRGKAEDRVPGHLSEPWSFTDYSISSMAPFISSQPELGVCCSIFTPSLKVAQHYRGRRKRDREGHFPFLSPQSLYCWNDTPGRKPSSQGIGLTEGAMSVWQADGTGPSWGLGLVFQALPTPRHLIVHFYLLSFWMPCKHVDIIPSSPPSCGFPFPATSLHWFLCCLCQNSVPRSGWPGSQLCGSVQESTELESPPCRATRCHQRGAGGTTWAEAFLCLWSPFLPLWFWNMWTGNNIQQRFSTRNDFAPQRTFGIVWTHFWLSQLRVSYLNLVGRGQGWYETCSAQNRAHDKELSSPKCTEVKKPWYTVRPCSPEGEKQLW